MEFSREEYSSGLWFPTPKDLPDPGIEPTSPALAGGFSTTSPPGKSQKISYTSIKKIMPKGNEALVYDYSQYSTWYESISWTTAIKEPEKVCERWGNTPARGQLWSAEHHPSAEHQPSSICWTSSLCYVPLRPAAVETLIHSEKDVIFQDINKPKNQEPRIWLVATNIWVLWFFEDAINPTLLKAFC